MDIRGGLSVLFFLSEAATITRVHGNVGLSKYMRVKHQLYGFILQFGSDLGIRAGRLLIIDNATHHHKALHSMAEKWGNYPLTTVQQANLLREEVPNVALDQFPSLKRAQFYFLR